MIKNITVVMASILFSNVRSTFHFGRVKPGKFEYPKLNGWMSVEQAVHKCENDFACGGFTFKGSYRTNHTPNEIYFFHVVMLPEESHQTFVRSLVGFLSRFEYLSKQFQYLRDMKNALHQKTKRYLYWSTYKVDRCYVHISHLKVKEVLSSNSKELRSKYVKGFGAYPPAQYS